MTIGMIRWEITNKCDLECKHCFIDDNAHSREDLSVTQNIELLNRLVKLGVRKIVFSSKEPLIYEDLDKLIYECEKRNIKTEIVTNGIQLSNEDFAKKLLKTSISSIYLSMEGITAKTNDFIRGEGSFDKIIESIKHIKAHSNVYLGIQMIISSQNIMDSVRIPDFFNKLGIDSLSIGGISLQGNAINNVDIIPTARDYSDAQEQIVIAYNNLPNKTFQLHLKSSYPIETAYLNLRTGSRFLPYIPKCSVLSDNFSLMNDGRLIPCISILNSNYFSNMLFEVDLHNSEIFPDVTMMKSEIQDYIMRKRPITCSKCHFNEVCLPCPMIYESGDGAEQCRVATRRFDDILKEAIDIDCAFITLNDNLVVSVLQEKINIKIYDCNNNYIETSWIKSTLNINFLEHILDVNTMRMSDLVTMIGSKNKTLKVLRVWILDNIIRLEGW